MSATLQLPVQCASCGERLAGTTPITECPRCGGLLDAVIDTTQRLTPSSFDAPRYTLGSTSGVWRYRQLLPAIADEHIVSRREGNTPIYWHDRIATYAGIEPGRLGVKHEGHNPTGSFKDRGMTVAVSHAKSVGASVIACASTGNTSASLASYAATAGIPSMVLIPDGKISMSKLSQTLAFGAKVVQVAGDFDAALQLLREVTAEFDVYLANSVNPFRPEGQKTIVLEMLEELGWQAPDVIALPGGNLGNTAAFGKALVEAYAVGLIDRLPRVVTVQAEGASPFYRYFQSGFDHYEPMTPNTIASAINIGAPASVDRARRTIQNTGGLVACVTDEELLDAKAVIDAAGIGCEPASATTVAGIRKLVADGEISSDARVVCVLTGNVLKDTDNIVKYHLDDVDGAPRERANRPIRIEATMDAMKKVLDDAILS
ncbi:MAG: threonine synthase [Thermomicrobiales bacterium]|nr:threonine synthase [Thermomicrobiales bacterium]MCO5225843.1 threonine synthase [Thermomicrobiales bacterium]MCO5228400.1 threonine synthase [Thermomicrobiales bacterium]